MCVISKGERHEICIDYQLQRWRWKNHSDGEFGGRNGLPGEKVLVIDLDPQTNLTFSFMKVDEWQEHYEKTRTIQSWFDSITHKKSHKPHFEDLVVTKHGIDIICSHLGLIDVDLDLAAGLTGGSPKLQMWNYINTYSHIKNELHHLNDVYDVVLFDCPRISAPLPKMR